MPKTSRWLDLNRRQLSGTQIRLRTTAPLAAFAVRWPPSQRSLPTKLRRSDPVPGMSAYADTGHSAHRVPSIEAAERSVLAEFAEMIV